METTHSAPLTATEIAHLWTSFQNDTMALCGIKYFLAHVDDHSTRELLEYALELSVRHVQKVKEILTKEKYPIPQGFTEQDVNLEAPRLFTDALYIHYITNMGNFGLTSYGTALAMVSREDILDYYATALAETTELAKRGTYLSIEKGIYIRPPIIPAPDQIDFVKDQSFLTGFFGERRPLLGVEIGDIVYNAKRNGLGLAIIQGFSQVARNKEVRKYFERGRDISKKHLKVFSTFLEENYLSQGAINLMAEVTDSTVPPFSDKLMMFHIAALSASGIGQYGISLSTSPRHDLGVLYSRLSTELLHYSEDGANMMINHGWMEQPPQSADRKKLSK
ncbi:uncharacterized protein DUF3231 [Bacillus oleivorans]|uniref:Uncharacterized protein DUF3231 n=1 Tax=Bacillus oleivorans TaxID=1448271 RepID=A0A285D3V9_9BACI|nr:DUF3231 family protein [Bacillus oleivorans]SNX74490.1 uncharacterized protein DUF3231 [Bacillus oleivorans]